MPRDVAAAPWVAVDSFGVTIEVAAGAPHMPAVRNLLPPGAKPVNIRPDRGRFALVATGTDGLVDVTCDDQSVAGPVDLRLALGILDARMRLHVALNAPEHIFVHAGVVGIGGRAIVMPGKSFAGKTSLVAALVAAGAEYWSDEYAVLDAEGRVHPYAKPLSVRLNSTWLTEERTVESLGGRAGDRPLPVALIAVTHYRPGESWEPCPCSPGVGAIKMLEHTVPAQTRPEQALAAVRRAAAGAAILEGHRGEAEETAAALISVLETSPEGRGP